MLAQHGFNFHGKDTHPTDFDHFFATAEVMHKTMRVNDAAVPGTKPALMEGLRCGLRLAPVAFENGGATHTEFTRLTQRQGLAGVEVARHDGGACNRKTNEHRG